MSWTTESNQPCTHSSTIDQPATSTTRHYKREMTRNQDGIEMVVETLDYTESSGPTICGRCGASCGTWTKRT